MSKVKTARCKWFNDVRGYGFLVEEGVEGDIIAHHSVIEMPGYRKLAEGQQVRFTEENGPRGRTATWVAVEKTL